MQFGYSESVTFVSRLPVVSPSYLLGLTMIDLHMDLQPKFISPGWSQNLQAMNLNEHGPKTVVMFPRCLAKSKC